MKPVTPSEGGHPELDRFPYFKVLPVGRETRQSLKLREVCKQRCNHF